MSDRKTIDFTAERNKRKGGGETGGGIGSVPDYMKILYGEEAVDHMESDEEGFFDDSEDVSLDAPAPKKKREAAEPRKKRALYGVQETDFDREDEFSEGDFGEGEDIIIDGVTAPADVKKSSKKKKELSPEAAEKAAIRAARKEERKKKSDQRLERAINEPMVKKPMGEKQRKSSTVKAIIVASVAAVLMIVFAVASIIGVTKNSVYQLSYVGEGEIVKKGHGEACFIRQGDVLKAESGGIFVPNVNEGDKVPAGYTVGYITDDEYVNDVLKLRNLEKVILSMQAMDGVTSAPDQSELAAAEESVSQYRQKLAEMAASGKLQECSDVMVQLTAALSYRNQIIIEAESGNSSVSSLQKERNELAKRLSSKMKPVKTQSAGVVSFSINGGEGLENDLYPNMEKQNEGYTVKTDNIKTDTVYIANTQVQSGQSVARVVTSQDYYVVMETAEDYTAYLGKKITVTSDDGKFNSTGKILSVTPVTGGGNSVIIKTNKSLRSSLDGAKNVSFEISRTSGYCVPLSALDDWDKPGHTARIAVVRAGVVKFVYVTVIDHDDEFAVIRNNVYSDSDIYYGDTPAEEDEPIFKANDCYIVNPKGIKEGQVIT